MLTITRNDITHMVQRVHWRVWLSLFGRVIMIVVGRSRGCRLVIACAFLKVCDYCGWPSSRCCGVCMVHCWRNRGELNVCRISIVGRSHIARVYDRIPLQSMNEWLCMYIKLYNRVTCDTGITSESCRWNENLQWELRAHSCGQNALGARSDDLFDIMFLCWFKYVCYLNYWGFLQIYIGCI